MLTVELEYVILRKGREDIGKEAGQDGKTTWFVTVLAITLLRTIAPVASKCKVT